MVRTCREKDRGRCGKENMEGGAMLHKNTQRRKEYREKKNKTEEYGE